MTGDWGPGTGDRVHLNPCNCGPPASAWIATKFMTRSSAHNARPKHLPSSPAGCLFRNVPNDRIDPRNVPGRWKPRARKRSARIVKCCSQRRGAATESGERFAAVPWASRSSGSLDGSGGRTIGRALTRRRAPTKGPPTSQGVVLPDARGTLGWLPVSSCRASRGLDHCAGWNQCKPFTTSRTAVK